MFKIPARFSGIFTPVKTATHRAPPLMKQRFLSTSLPKITMQDRSFAIKFPAISGVATFHYSWLRDNCQCPQCLHPSTKQKLLSSGSIPSDIKPEAWEIDKDRLKITWNTSLDSAPERQHSSSYDLAFLRRYRYTKSNLAHQRSLDHPTIPWTSDVFSETNAWKTFAELCDTSNNERHLYEFNLHLQKYGLGFISGVPNQDLAVETVAQRFGPIRETFYGRSWDVKSVPNAKNIAYTSLYLGLHMDLLYFESPPGLQFLHCLKSSVTGGESIFLDSFKAVEIMKEKYPEQLVILEKVPVTFHYINSGRHMRFQRPTVVTNDLNHCTQVNYAPPFQGPLEVNANRVEAFYEAFKTFERVMQDESLLYTIRLRPGDCVIFANRRILHGRLAFNGLEGERHLKGTYTDWDVFMDRYRAFKQHHE